MNEISEFLKSRRARITTSLDRPVSLLRFVFLDPRSRVFYRRWDDLAGDIAQTMIVDTAEPGTPSQAALDRLGRGATERAEA